MTREKNLLCLTIMLAMSDELRTVGDNLRLSGNYFAIDRIIINLYLQGNPSVVSLVSAIVVSLERRTYQKLQPLYAKVIGQD